MASDRDPVGDDPRARALALWEDGTAALLSGDVEGAVDLFDRSLAVAPTAEAFTFRGWARSFQGRYDEAIADCERAIATDPSFGNPYNDIGCYLLERGRAGEAPAWFEKAKRAERYEPRHFPCLNLGRLLSARGEVAAAIVEFHEALVWNPGDSVALAFLEKLRYGVN